MYEDLVPTKKFDCSAYLQMLKSLFPFGILWRFTIGLCSAPDEYSILGKLMSCFALELNRFEEKVIELFTQMIPGLSTDAEFLTDWETMLGLPDECLAGLSQTETQRQVNAHTKYTIKYTGMPAQFYIDYAASLGSTISITDITIYDNQPFRTNDATDIDETRVEPHTSPGGSTGSEGLIPGRLYSLGARHSWQVNGTFNDSNKEIIECIFNRLKPAWTIVIFKWGDIAPAGIPSAEAFGVPTIT